MSRGRFFALLILVACGLVAGSSGQAKVVRQDENTWVVENQALRVTLHAERGSFDVLDKRCGRLWRGRATTPHVALGWQMPAASERIKLDGRVSTGEWPAPEVSLTAADLTEGKTPRSPADLSASFHAAWRPEALLVAVVVRDEAVHFPARDEEKWWEWDSVEFWLDGQQYALLPAPPGGVIVAMGKGEVAGSQVFCRRTAEGWEAEFSMPWPKGRVSRGAKLRFALGVNDAEQAAGGRQTQLYFPASWRHSDPSTFARTVLGAAGVAPRPLGSAAAGEVTDIKPLASGDGLTGTTHALSGGGGQMWEGKLTLKIEAPADLVVMLDRQPHDAGTSTFTMLAPLASDRPAEIYGARYCNGIAVPDDDRRFRGRSWGAYGSVDMPWVGYGSSSGPGYVLLAEDPNDATFRLEPRGQEGRLVPVLYHVSEKGKLGYARAARYGFVDRGGFVAMCKWYRQLARKHGILKTLREKMKTRPQLDRLPGAPDFWGLAPATCDEMRRLGIRHALVNGRWQRSIMEHVRALGYLVSRYDNYEDLLEGPRDQYGRGKIPDDVVKRADGSLMTAWLTWDKKTQYMKRCSVLYEQTARLQIPKDLAEHPYNARFLDVTTACGLRECYDKVHPCTRTEDVKARQRLANYVANELKLVLGGEHGRWWGVPYYDYWEGMQSGGFYSWPAGHVGINIPEKREDIGQMYWEYGIGEKRRVPLWELVFGDCVQSTWYWGDSTGHLYKAAPDIADRKDCFNLLYGTVPLYWTSRPYSFRWSDPDLRLRLLQSYFVTCPVQELVAFEEMTDYRYLTPDRTVHQSRFANGLTVTVNFGSTPYTAAAEGRKYTLPQFGFLVSGGGALAYRATRDGRTVTFVRTPVTVYCDGGGREYDFGLVRTAGLLLHGNAAGRADQTEVVLSP
ncbi:MAG: hypothetical protein J7M26_08825, partial [Armatimonadetes bacterium]|nr:hypothetical protein [Armatimonadota bacterium]